MPDTPIQTPPDSEAFEIRKDVVIAHAGKNFKNGKTSFDLTTASIDEMIENFARLKRQVKIFLSFDVPDQDHQFNADLPATGWVEGMRREGNDWIASIKLHGNGAAVVKNDEVRGISIGTMRGRDIHGKPTGEFLDHLLITNVPFFADLNIAASDKQAECRVTYITACAQEEADDMADDKKDAETKLALQDDEEEKKDEMQDEEEEVIEEGEFTEANFKKMKKLATKLRRLILGLKADLETRDEHIAGLRLTAGQGKEALAVRVEVLERENMAQAIREVVAEGHDRLTLKSGWTDGYKGEEGDGGAGTLTWLKASRFSDNADKKDIAGALRTLKYQVFQGTPITTLNKDYSAGQVKADSLTLTQDEHELVRKLGLTPEQIKRGLKAQSASDMPAPTKKES